MTDTAVQKSYTAPISLSSLMQILTGLNPYAVLYADPIYGIDEHGVSYYPELVAKPMGRAGLSFRAILSKTPVTVGEFVTFLRDGVTDLGNEGHKVDLNYPAWMAFSGVGILPFGGGHVNGVIINGDGSYTLSREEAKYWK
jgi:hypothetical protein